MRAPLFLLLLPLLQSPVYQHATGSGLNVTEDEQNMSTVNTTSVELFSSGAEYEEAEEDRVKEAIAPQFLVSNTRRDKSSVKNPAKLENGRKTSNKPKRKRTKEKKTKKKTRSPCEGKYKSFCVHGKCIHIEQFHKPRCICLPDYFGERCMEQFLKTRKTNNEPSLSKTVLVVVSVLLSVLCFAIIVIIITEQVRKKCRKYNEIEERKNLQQENGIPNNNV